MGLGADSIQNKEDKDKLRIGDEVVVVGGKHHGQEGVVAKNNQLEYYIRIEMDNGIQIKVDRKQVVRSKVFKANRKLRSRSRSREKVRKTLEWVCNNIKVKVIDNKRTDLYLKKIVI